MKSSDQTDKKSPKAVPQKPEIAGPVITGILLLLLFFGGFIGWASYAPLSNAAIAPGHVKVETERKTVQHLEGGIIEEILVRNGDKVKKGQVLIGLDETKPRAKLLRLLGQLEADETQLQYLNEEIETVIKLLSGGLTSKPRLLALQRQAAEVEGNRKKLQAEIKDAEDILSRSKIVAPIDGTIVGLKVHTTGGVIREGERLMDIVPENERLIIQANLNPIDIDVVHTGLEAMIYLTPYNRRSLKPIRGRVVTVSADLMTNQTNGHSYYLANVELLEKPGLAIKGASLYPGMPAEVMIITGNKTLVEALFQPFTQSMNRAFREN